eukprot:EG_transcript_13817
MHVAAGPAAALPEDGGRTDEAVGAAADRKRTARRAVLRMRLQAWLWGSRPRLGAALLVCVAVAALLVLGVQSSTAHIDAVYQREFEARLAENAWQRDWNVTVTEVRLLLTPLHGARPVWDVCRPFHPFGCMMAHPHVVVALQGSPMYRTFEYHPKWPPALKFLRGWGYVKRSDARQWTPTYRLGFPAWWVQFPARANLTLGAVEEWNRRWCCVYSVAGHNCQHYTVELLQFLTGQRVNFWLYDNIPLPTFLFVLFLVLHFVSFPVMRQAFLLGDWVVTFRMRCPPKAVREDFLWYLKFDALLVVLAAGLVWWFVALCDREFRVQTAFLQHANMGVDR